MKPATHEQRYSDFYRHRANGIDTVLLSCDDGFETTADAQKRLFRMDAIKTIRIL